MAKRSNLATLTFQQIQAELRRRARRAATLQRRRDRLARRIRTLDEQMRTMGGSVASLNGHPGRGRRRRASNKVTLVDALYEVLKGKTLRVTDAAEAVQKAGYKTASKTFRVQVNIALIKNPNMFRRVGRGLYTAK